MTIVKHADGCKQPFAKRLFAQDIAELLPEWKPWHPGHPRPPIPRELRRWWRAKRERLRQQIEQMTATHRHLPEREMLVYDPRTRQAVRVPRPPTLFTDHRGETFRTKIEATPNGGIEIRLINTKDE